MRKKWLGYYCSLIALLLNTNVDAQSYVFARLDGIPVNTAGWNFQGSSAVGNLIDNNNSEVVLCPARPTTSGAVFFNQPINLTICNKWKAEFDF